MKSPPQVSTGRTHRWAATACSLVVFWQHLFLFAVPAAAELPQREHRWHLGGSDCEAQLLRNVRHQAAGQLPACDQMIIHTRGGTFANAFAPVAPVRVIPELRFKVPMRSTMPGHQLTVRVRLPRSLDPQTGKPHHVTLTGPTYERPGSWQTLEVANLDSRLGEQVRILRANRPYPIDAREAFVDQVAVNAFGKAGTNEVWLRDPITEGGVAAGNLGQQTVATWVSHATPLAPQSSIRVRFQGDILEVNGRPFFARMIEDRGERWDFLKSLGFNTIRIAHTPTYDQIRIAEELDLWLIAPPPTSEVRLGRPFRRVLAWHVGDHLTARNWMNAKRTVEQLRDRSLNRPRPVIASAATNTAAYSQLFDALVHDRRPIGTTLSMVEYRRSLDQRCRLSEPGKPLWAVVQTELTPGVRSQLRRFGVSDDLHRVEADEMELMAFTAISRGCRGLAFASSQRLDEDSPAARLRAAALRRLNQRLELIASSVAAGRPTLTPLVESNNYVTTAWQTSKAWVFVICKTDPSHHQQPAYAVPPLEIKIPGASADRGCFLLDRGVATNVVGKRVAGGLKFEIADPPNVSLGVVTHSPIVLKHINRLMSEQLASAAELQRQLAEDALSRTRDVTNAAPEDMVRSYSIDRKIAQAAEELQHASASLSRGEFPAALAAAQDAYSLARKAGHQLQMPQRNRQALQATHPLAAQLATMGHYFRRSPEFEQSPNGSNINLLPGGDFERENTFHAAHPSDAWTVREFNPNGHTIDVSLRSLQPQSGSRYLHIAAYNGSQNRTVQETPHVWVQSPPVKIDADFVRISGWIRAAAVDPTAGPPVLIFDSYAGPALGWQWPDCVEESEQAKAIDQWQSFEFIRAVDSVRPLQLTIALQKWGVAEIDGVRIEPIPHDPQRP